MCTAHGVHDHSLQPDLRGRRAERDALEGTIKRQKIILIVCVCVVSHGRMVFRKPSVLQVLIITYKLKGEFIMFLHSSTAFYPVIFTPYSFSNLFFSTCIPVDLCPRYILLACPEPVKQGEIQGSCHGEGLQYNWSERRAMMNNLNDSTNLSFCWL